MVGPFLFATNMLAAKATADFIPPVALAFFRWLGALVLLAPVVWPRFWQQRRHLKREWPDLLVFGALGMGVCGAFVYIGADITSATNIGLIYSSSPVLILVIAGLFFGQQVGRLAGFGVGMVVAGVLMAWLLLGEAPAWYHCAGAALVLTGIRLANRSSADEHGNGKERA